MIFIETKAAHKSLLKTVHEMNGSGYLFVTQNSVLMQYICFYTRIHAACFLTIKVHFSEGLCIFMQFFSSWSCLFVHLLITHVNVIFGCLFKGIVYLKTTNVLSFTHPRFSKPVPNPFLLHTKADILKNVSNQFFHFWENYPFNLVFLSVN